MTRKAFVAVLAVIAILASLQASAAVTPVRLDPPSLLKKLQQTRPKYVSPDAKTQVRINYQNSRRLALDLIYYQWICGLTDSPVDIDRVDEITNALTESMLDSGVGWANSVLRGTGSTVKTINLQDEQIKALSDLRDTIRLGTSNRERSPMRAADVLNQAVSICSDRKMDLSGAVILVVLGDQYLAMDRYKESERCYERARGVLREYGARANLARVYEDLGTLYSNMRSYAVASESFKAAGDQWIALNRGDMAGKQYIQAGVALAAEGRRERAYERIMYGRQLSFTWAHTQKSYGQIVADLRDIGDFFLTQGDLLSARDMYDSAVEHAQLASNREGQARALKELAEVCRQIGDAKFLEQANQTMKKREQVLAHAVNDAQSAVWKTSQKTGQPVGELERLLPIIMLGGWASSELGNAEKAEGFYRHAASLYIKLGRAREAVQAMQSVAASCEARGEDEKALVARIEAVSAAESIESKSSTLLADAKGRVAESYESANKPEMATAVYTECESIYRVAGAARELAITLQKRGDLYMLKKDFEKAAKDFQEAASIYLNDIGEPWTAAQAYWRLADALMAAGDEKKVTSILADAIDNVERWCMDQSIDPDLEPLGSQILSLLYTRLIPLQVKLEEKEKAWQLLRASERYRWHSNLLRTLRAQDNPQTASVIDDYERASQGRPDVRPGGTIEVKRLAGSWPELVDYALLLRKWQPVYFRSMRVDPLSVAKLASYIPADSAVIDYMFTDTNAYAFVMTQGGGAVWQISGSRQRVEELARGFRQAIREAQDTVASGMLLPPVDWHSEEMKPMLTSLSGLYSLLIEPIRSELVSVTNLVFASSVELSGFPFHAFMRLTSDGKPRFLIEDYAVSYVGPNSLLDLISPGSRSIDPAKDRVAIFADPLGDLPGAREEAQFIQAAYPRSESYIGAKASEENFLMAAKSCTVLHVAAHHALDPEQSKFSITLASGIASDGVLGISELNQLRNPGVSLVVLSSCEALGSASLAADTELLSAEVLSVAGVPSVLGGLWKVSDKASAKLMEEFYRNLGSQTGKKAEALRWAQRVLIGSGQFSHPYYWAGFALYGNQN